MNPKINITKTKNISTIIDTTKISDLPIFLVEYQETGNSKTKQLFLNEKEVETFSKNGKVGEFDWRDSIMLIKNETLSIIEKYGFFDAAYLFKIANPEKPSPTICFSSNLSEDLENNEYCLVKMIKNPHGKIAWKDLNGNPHCEPFFINGSPMGELNDAKYHLDELAEELSLRNDIAFITHTSRFESKKPTILFAPLDGTEPSIGGIISNITHHLEEGEKEPNEKEEINLIYYPNKNNIEKILFYEYEKEPQDSTHRKNKEYFVERFILNEFLGAKYFEIQPEPEITKIRKFKH